MPLLYYFPGAESSTALDHDRARAFVYEVRDDPHDATKQIIEIVVDSGRDFVLSDIHVDVDGDRLVVSGERSKSRRTGSKSSLIEDDRASSATDEEENRQLIKQFTLPAHSDVTAVTSRRSDDGRLSILVPFRR